MNKEYFEYYVRDLRKEGFTDEQIAYFSPDHSYKQANIIKKGIKLGLDVSIFCNSYFNEDKMYEILLGLDKGVAVEEYAFLDFSSRKMNLIRLCLERGKIDILKYKKLDDNILRLIVQCWFNDKDITQYVKNKEYNVQQLAQIAQGILDDLDVSVYAKPEYDYLQMEQIRIGLERKLDVSIYANPDFDYIQMEYLRGVIFKIHRQAYELPPKEAKDFYHIKIEDVKLIARPYCEIDEMKEELEKINSLRNSNVI